MGPHIKTERLELRLPELDDAPDLARLSGDYDVAKNTSRIPSPYPVLAAEMWILSTRAGYRPGRSIALTATRNGQVAGGGGIFKRRPDAHWEIGYWIAKPFWGQGLATEMGEALIRFAIDDMGAERIIAGHNADNPASGRVLEKLGFAYDGREEPSWSMARLGKAAVRYMKRAA